MADYPQWDNAITPLSGDEQVVIFQNGHEVKTDASNFGGGVLPTDGFPNQALLFGNPPFWGTDIIGRTGDDAFPTGDTVTLTGGDARSPTLGSAGGVRLTGGISGPGQTASQFLIENTSGGEGGLIQINAGSDGTGGSIGAIINLSAGGFTGSGHGGVVELVPGTGTSPGFLLLTNLPTSAPAQPTGVWNNSGSLNIGPSLGSGTATAVAGAATLNTRAGIVTSEGLTGATTYTLTLHNSLIAATSVVLVNLTNSAGTVTNLLTKAETSGQVVVGMSMAALTGTVKIDFSVSN